MRVCPERDAVCPHGMDCPYSDTRYSCRDGWQTLPGALNPDSNNSDQSKRLIWDDEKGRYVYGYADS